MRPALAAIGLIGVAAAVGALPARRSRHAEAAAA